MFLGANYAREVAVNDWRRRGVTETMDGRVQQSIGAAQRWEFIIGLQTDVFGKRELLARIAAHRRAHQFSGVFDLLVPQPLGQPDLPSGLALAVPVKADAGATSLRFRRTSADRWDVPIGRYVKFAGHDKIYAVQEAKSLPARNTNYEVEIYPSLRRDVAANAAVDASPSAKVKWHPDGIDEMLQTVSGSIFTYRAAFLESV